VDVMATEVKRDKTLKENSTPGIGSGEKAEQTSRRTSERGGMVDTRSVLK
jgi:hypothetical protein